MKTQPRSSFPRQGGALRAFFALMVAALVFAGEVRAQQIGAELSQAVTSIGQPVQLNISIEGGDAKPPQELKVDGFDIQFMGRSQRISVVNFKMSSSTVYSYRVIPLEAGDFVLPAFAIKINGRSYETEPLSLRVAANPGGMPGRQSPQQRYTGMPPALQPPPTSSSATPPPAEGKLAFGELIVPKKSAYAGEVIPVELRFYFAANHPAQISNPNPNFAGNGFTVLNFSKPIQRDQEIDGQPYNVLIFQTAITPVKAGDLEIQPATIDAQMELPGRASSNVDDFLGAFLNGSGLGGEIRQMTVPTNAVKLEVKSLPEEGKPEDFGGAIGQFSMSATASPKKAAAGEPVNLDVVVSGRGNFDGMSAPTLEDADAWKTYPPSEKFKASTSDPIGYNGQKTFEYAIVAHSDTNQTPSPVFSFFDPAVGKYVTLKSNPVAVSAKADGLATPAPVAVASSAPDSSATPPPAAAPSPAPATGLVENFQSTTFEPFVLGKTFLTVNGVAALAWLAVVCFGIGRALTQSSLARRAGQRREAKRLLNRVDDPKATAAEVIQYAAEFVRFRLAPEGSPLETRELLVTAVLSDSTREKVGELLDRGDEWRYSTGGISSRLGAEDRQQIAHQLKTFDEELRH